MLLLMSDQTFKKIFFPVIKKILERQIQGAGGKGVQKEKLCIL